MDYERMYKDALERAKSWAEGKEDLGASARSVCEFIFPELAESEDERMRKLIMDRVRSATEMTEGLRELLLTYLEKQKECVPEIAETGTQEQKPISQEDFDTAKDEALWGEQKPNIEICPHSIKSKSYSENPITPEMMGKAADDPAGVDINWESFRREAAKDVLCAMLIAGVNDTWKRTASEAINAADELVKQLQSITTIEQ